VSLFVRALVVACVLAGGTLHAQICRVSVAGLNRNRAVMGPVNVECPPSIHTAPLGNWGVSSNFGTKQNGQQFQGWCNNSRVCDNRGTCWTDCRDGWFEWNSCTSNALYSAPNCTLYNDANCTRQVTTTGVNVHGTRISDVVVRCPVDTNGDGTADEGGCLDAAVYRSGTNYMSLYELDPGTTDELVQTIYFPEVVMQMPCDVWGCRAIGSEWLKPAFYDSPAEPARVTAEFAALVNFAVFLDNNRGCRAVAPAPAVLSSASYAGGAVAPDSLVTLFGRGLATSSSSAATTNLPVELAGTRVNVTDSAGVTRAAGLYFASPDQVNLILPAGTAEGAARLVVSRADTVSASSTFMVANVAPAVFTANADGRGVAAATAVRVSRAGQTAVAVFRCDGGPGSCVAEPMDLGSEGERLFVSLYGTGLRRAPGALRAFAGGLPLVVQFAGAQGQYPGLDQINLEIPAALRGVGVVEIELEQEGTRSNRVVLSFR
jgi:uncharacterized protein (TIGR03437 family)